MTKDGRLFEAVHCDWIDRLRESPEQLSQETCELQRATSKVHGRTRRSPRGLGAAGERRFAEGATLVDLTDVGNP